MLGLGHTQKKAGIQLCQPAPTPSKMWDREEWGIEKKKRKKEEKNCVIQLAHPHIYNPTKKSLMTDHHASDVYSSDKSLANAILFSS